MNYFHKIFICEHEFEKQIKSSQTPTNAITVSLKIKYSELCVKCGIRKHINDPDTFELPPPKVLNNPGVWFKYEIKQNLRYSQLQTMEEATAEYEAEKKAKKLKKEYKLKSKKKKDMQPFKINYEEMITSERWLN